MHFSAMSNLLKAYSIRTTTGLVLASTFWITYLELPPIALSLLFGFSLLGILVLEWPRLVPFSGIKGILFTLLYPVTPIICLLLLNHDPTHRELIALIYITVPSFDTGSYFAGTLLGTRKLWKRMSQHKTWEGFAGGCIATWIALLFYAAGTNISWYQTILLTALIAPLALMGDLFESLLKRRAQVKDSGFLLPGHGGLLDRFDSVLFVSVVCYLLRTQIIRLIHT